MYFYIKERQPISRISSSSFVTSNNFLDQSYKQNVVHARACVVINKPWTAKLFVHTLTFLKNSFTKFAVRYKKNVVRAR